MYVGQGLGVKGTVWSAGFPIRNLMYRIHPLMRPNIDLVQDEDGSGEYYSIGASVNPVLGHYAVLTDFLGPEVDLGFRLKSSASARRLAVSMDAAYFLAHHTPPNWPIIFTLVGWVPLKGVYGDHPYPIVWVDFALEKEIERRTVFEGVTEALAANYLSASDRMHRDDFAKFYSDWQRDLQELGAYRIQPYIRSRHMDPEHVRITEKQSARDRVPRDIVRK
jgi:hypothetical protein